MLRIEKLSVHYGVIQAVDRASLELPRGTLTALVGANGAGKSSLLWALVGGIPRSGGEVYLDDRPLPPSPHEVVRRGVALVPERRRLFGELSVGENLRMGGYLEPRESVRRQRQEEVFSLFPGLADRMKQQAGTLSGGEQQMLAIGRALMGGPRLLLLDEPTLGLAPLLAEQVLLTLGTLRDRGMTLLLAEQNAVLALEVADKAAVMETGRLGPPRPARELAQDPAIRRAYLGEE